MPELCLDDPMSVDDLLLGSPIASENPVKKPQFVIDWPYTIGRRRSYRGGPESEYRRYPSGLLSRSIVDGVPMRLKIYVDIGMLAIDRDIRTSCLWRTRFCSRHCYNRALMRVRPNIKKSGEADELFWEELDGELLYDMLHSESFRQACGSVLRKSPGFMRARMRLATRGEAFAEPSDARKVADICEGNPNTTFWVTTRAWTDNSMTRAIEKYVIEQPNIRLLASLDPSHTASQFDRIARMGWNTTFFGDDEFTEGRFLCPKSWEKKASYCRICKNGCFKNGPVHVHLAVHGTRVEPEELTEFRGRPR
jgi:hypothetical protein